jgi:hypothetical protein
MLLPPTSFPIPILKTTARKKTILLEIANLQMESVSKEMNALIRAEENAEKYASDNPK